MEWEEEEWEEEEGAAGEETKEAERQKAARAQWWGKSGARGQREGKAARRGRGARSTTSCCGGTDLVLEDYPERAEWPCSRRHRSAYDLQGRPELRVDRQCAACSSSTGKGISL